MLPPFGPIEEHKWFFPDPSSKGLRKTGLQLPLSAKSSFYLPAFQISRSCRTAKFMYRPAFSELSLVSKPVCRPFTEIHFVFDKSAPVFNAPADIGC